jgi:hypothetical protein
MTALLLLGAQAAAGAETSNTTALPQRRHHRSRSKTFSTSLYLPTSSGKLMLSPRSGPSVTASRVRARTPSVTLQATLETHMPETWRRPQGTRSLQPEAWDSLPATADPIKLGSFAITWRSFSPEVDTFPPWDFHARSSCFWRGPNCGATRGPGVPGKSNWSTVARVFSETKNFWGRKRGKFKTPNDS